jgi:hypothetical protein
MEGLSVRVYRFMNPTGRWVVGVLLLLLPYHGHAQQLCPGDVDGDGQVTPADAEALLPLLFQGADVDPEVAQRADANGDGVLSSADVTAILLHGIECASPTPVPTPTGTLPSPKATATFTPTQRPSPTSTATSVANTSTVTATPTRTVPPLPTPTPTQVCAVQTAQLGTVTGELTTSDCQREFEGELRYTDAYSLTGTVGQAIMVQITAVTPIPTTPPAGTPSPSPPTLQPFLTVIDPGGQFDSAAGSPPF